MDHTMASRAGTYVTVPMLALNVGESTSGGTGITISTLLAMERDLNCDLAFTRYSMRECACGSTTVCTQNSGLTCVDSRYVSRSNSPSGGMKLMVRSFSNRASRTHWWNLMSSSSTAFPLLRRPELSKSTLSLRPSFSSGIPDRNTRMCTLPTISLCSTAPDAATSRFSFSMTSKNTSFLRCLMPSGRQLTTLVTAVGALLTSILWLSSRMNSFRIDVSLVCGYPLSIISSNSS
mmetsp:Transcript_13907/g.48449  ORF Transcript_13907/g.48449 Transcript_13907/m.48449 type:complete len:234 (+) Transcript_13907:626-1327(+)